MKYLIERTSEEKEKIVVLSCVCFSFSYHHLTKNYLRRIYRLLGTSIHLSILTFSATSLSLLLQGRGHDNLKNSVSIFFLNSERLEIERLDDDDDFFTHTQERFDSHPHRHHYVVVVIRVGKKRRYSEKKAEEEMWRMSESGSTLTRTKLSESLKALTKDRRIIGL